MPEVKWIKIVTDIFDDEKMLLIESLPSADSLIVIWFKLLCLAGKNNNNGVFLLNDRIAYTDEMLATIFRRDVNTVRLALKTFEDFGMIDVIEGVITIPNWGKHQTLDKLERKTEYMRNYMRDYRERQKLQIECKTNRNTNSNSNVSEADIDIDKDNKDIDKDIDKDNTPLPHKGEVGTPYDFKKHSNVDNTKHILNNRRYKEWEYIKNSSGLWDVIKEWMEYKDAKMPRKSHHYQTEMGITKLLSQFVNAHKKYGIDTVKVVVNDSIASEYTGIVWDWLEKKKTASSTGSYLDTI